MIMRYTWILLMPFFAVGCATQRPVAVQAPPPVQIAAVTPTKVVETPYDVRGYREAANPAIRHEAHAVYRRTRVPITAGDELATVPRTTYPPVSFAPLPASDELAAELATQKKITADLRVMEASMAEAEQRMQAQYAMLVRQSAEALKVREQLEAERSRARGATPGGIAATPAGETGAKPEVKW
jgi:hypothetical protein